MPSGFVEHHIRTLATYSTPSLHEASTSSLNPASQTIQSALASSNSPLSPDDLRQFIHNLQRLHSSETQAQTSAAVSDVTGEAALMYAAINKATVGLYAEVLDLHLKEALELDAEAEWWGELERSRLRTAYYLLQSLPLRLSKLSRIVLDEVHARASNPHPIFCRSSIREFFISPGTLRPNAYAIALFPHLKHQPVLITSLRRTYPSSRDLTNTLLESISRWKDAVLELIVTPLELVSQECHQRRKELEKLRDDRAEILGILSGLRKPLTSALDHDRTHAHLPSLIATLQTLTSSGAGSTHDFTPASSISDDDTRGLVAGLSQLAEENIPQHTSLHSLRMKELNRPSRLVLLWPRLLFVPTTLFFCIRLCYTSRATLIEAVKDTKDTMHIFFRSWVLEPVTDVIKTIRAGKENGVIIRPEGIEADFASLERMALALAKDKLNFGPDELQSLSQRVRTGDLTQVLQLYEEDIKTPLKSALRGSLLRSLFIQVQKAKVDIDQALSGIDKLLKSQELTFAFVGVAPALGVVYIAGGFLMRTLLGSGKKDLYGGKRRRMATWNAIRRIERLLLTQPASSKARSSAFSVSQDSIMPVTAGLLLLSVTRLRNFAETNLPQKSRIREGFVQDVEDLEDPELRRDEKLRVVDRMWKSWGKALGWDNPT